MFSLNPNSNCPCGSRQDAVSCCLSTGVFFKQESDTRTKPPYTNESQSGCYASQLADCSGGLSREHFISESLLNHLNKSQKLSVGGLSWIGSEQKSLPPNALASRILCQRHNASLSTIDAIAVRLFKAFDENEKEHNREKSLFLFSGHDLERWLLKILCGMAFSRNLVTDTQVDTSLPKSWLEILFGIHGFPDRCGLYMCNEKGHIFDGPHGLTVRPITNKTRLTGIGLTICGYEFILSMSGFKNRIFNGRRFVYRPNEVYFRRGEYERSVLLSWKGSKDGGSIICDQNGHAE